MLFAENKIGTSSQKKKRPQIILLFPDIHHMSNMTEFAHVWLGTVYLKKTHKQQQTYCQDEDQDADVCANCEGKYVSFQTIKVGKYILINP